MHPFLDTFDDYIDDLLASDIHLLRGELDLLLMQYLYNSIDLKIIDTTDFCENDSLAA